MTNEEDENLNGELTSDALTPAEIDAGATAQRLGRERRWWSSNGFGSATRG